MADSVINTFEKGLHQDSSFMLQPDGTYRNMKNGMLISYDGNHYTIEMSNGNRNILTLPPRYSVISVPFNVLVSDKIPIAIGFSSFIDDLAVFHTNDETDGGGYGEIGLIKFSRANADFSATYTPYYNHKDLKFSKQHQIESISFKENDNVKRTYFTDNHNEPRVFNFNNKIFTTYIGTTSITIGKTYMVLGGIVEHPVGSGAYYGPCSPNSFVLGNIFTATTTSYVVYLDTPKVIEYFDIKLLSWSPDRLLGDITFSEYGTGNKNCGSSIYFYRLSLSTEGVQSTWSFPSAPMQSIVDNFAAYLTGNKYKDSVGGGGDTGLVTSKKSIKVKIDNIDTNFDTIELCCAEYNNINDIPTSIRIVNKSLITGASMTIEDIGNIDLGEVTISDLTLFPASIKTVKTLTTDKGYNLIANLTERDEFFFDTSGIAISQFPYPMTEHGSNQPGNCNNVNSALDVSPAVAVNPSSGSCRPYTRWLVTIGDNTNTVFYNGVQYFTGQVITCISGFSTILFVLNGAVRPCTTKNKYTVSNPASPNFNERVEDAIELKTAFWNYKDPAVASHNLGYWSVERYRFGLLFYDKKGNPFYTKWIKDFDFSTINTKGGLMVTDTDTYALNASGINVSALDLPQEIIDKIGGFSIVRAERDARVITQGLVMQSVFDATVGNERIMPVPVSKTSITYNNPYDGLYTYLCPDDLVSGNPGGVFKQSKNGKTYGNIGGKMEEACWLDGAYLRSASNPQFMFTKMINHVNNDGYFPRKFEVNSSEGEGFRRLNEEDVLFNVDATGRTYVNKDSPINTANLLAISNSTGSCAASPFPTNITYSYSSGCRKIIFKSAINHYNTTDGYGTNAQAFNYNKLMANCVTGAAPASQYGGQSNSAIANTLYLQIGHYQKIDAFTLANTANGTFSAGTYTGQNKYTFNNIEVFGGDCYLSLIDIGYGLYNDVQNLQQPLSVGLYFPCECNSNYNLRAGLKISAKGMFPVIGGIMAYTQGGNSYPEGYRYNKSYSTDGSNVLYPALPLTNSFVSRFETRARFAGKKYLGEAVDSFRKFLINDFIDLDIRYGEINNIRSKDNRVLVWQNKAINSVPVLERQLLGASSGASTTIGTGGVIDRFDPITSFYGNQHQFGLTQTEFGFMWFDMRNRALCIMGMSGEIQEISLAKGLQTYFNSEFNEGYITGNKIYNTDNYMKKEIPLMGYGITGSYDPKFKMSYLTFKYDYYSVNTIEDYSSLTNKDFTVGYSHILNAIVGFYDFTPAIYHNHNDLMLSVNNSKHYVYYGLTMLSTNFKVGNVIKVNPDSSNLGAGEYVCISPVTISAYPPPIANTNPLFTGSTYWLKINSQDQIYIQNFGADICKFYGKVYNHELELAIKTNKDLAVTPQNIQFKAIGPNWNSVECFTDNQSSADLNIAPSSRDYRFIDGAWFSSLPMDRLKGRLTDYYVRIKFTYNNYSTNPTTAKNIQKVSQFIKTFFVTKR